MVILVNLLILVILVIWVILVLPRVTKDTKDVILSAGRPKTGSKQLREELLTKLTRIVLKDDVEEVCWLDLGAEQV